MSKKLVLSVKPYDFENKQGNRVKGAKIAYVNSRPSPRENEVGYPPLLVSVSDPKIVDSIREVPAIYDMDFEQVTGKNNKPELVLYGAEFVSPVDISSIF